MYVGALSEQRMTESRVCLTPSDAASLVLAGHEVVVESGAGASARFSDEDYRVAGARVVYDRDEVFGRSELVMKVSPLRPADLPSLRPGTTVLAFHHLAAGSRELVQGVLKRGVTLIGFEVIEDAAGDLPILHAMSEIAGQLSVHAAAHFLETHGGGRGILLGGATGIPPAHVLILGAGVVGIWAARTAAGNRAQVTVMDSSIPALRRVEEALGRRVVTEMAHPDNVARAAADADVIIGAILIRGDRAPHVVTRRMVETMKPGSVIVDVSIDQGGCVETSRPTSLENPVFVEAGVTHHAIPNMTSAVARTASLALSHAALSYVQILAERGIEAALREHPNLAAGLYAYRGHLVSPSVARVFGEESEHFGEKLLSLERLGRLSA
jgi:alanine dehydrogenase